MATYGLLIDYEYCTNCGSCQVSCKEEHGYPVGKTGIAVHADGPWYIDDDNINFNYFPLPTDLCDLCKDRTARGREPICVHHCLANILYYGTVEELSKKLEESPSRCSSSRSSCRARPRASSSIRRTRPMRTRQRPWRSPALVPRPSVPTAQTPRVGEYEEDAV